MTFPSPIRAGDFIQWNIPASQDYYGNSISSPDWSVVYYLRTKECPDNHGVQHNISNRNKDNRLELKPTYFSYVKY